MIRYLPEADLRLERGCILFPASGTQIYGYASRYGGNFPFCTSWAVENKKGEIVGVLGRFNSSLRLSCSSLSPEVFQELADFLTVLSWDTLEGPADRVMQLAERLDLDTAGHISLGNAMERRKDHPCPVPNSPPILEQPDFSEVFRILKGSVPDVSEADEMEWRRDASHMVRHRGGTYVSIGGQSVAGITAYSPKWGLISQVATLPEGRGKGYASALVAWCVNALRKKGQDAVLLCGEENRQAEDIYQKLGFVRSGRFAVLRRIPALLSCTRE